MIIIFAIWFGNTKLKAFPFHVVKKSMYKSCSYCCNRCWKNPIFYIFLLKKKFQKKIFVQKKSKNQNWPIFDFSLIGSSVFELEPKNCKIEKAGRTLPTGVLLPACVVCAQAGRSTSVGKVLPAFSILQFLALTRKPNFQSSWNQKLGNFDYF